jgi:hypothetical protein
LQIGPELYTNLPDKNSTLAIEPLAGEAARLRPIPASRRRSRPGKQLGSARGSPRATGHRRWGGGTTGEVGRRRPGAVAVTARGNRRGRGFLGQQANWEGSLGASEATRAAGRRRARAGARAQGGGNGAVELGVARCGEERAAFIGGLGSVVTTA